jgi:hypothetical protein
MIVRLLLSLLAVMVSVEASQDEFRTYRDRRLEFSFRYPADYTFVNVLESPNGFVSGILKQGMVNIVVEAKDLSAYPDEWRVQGRTRFVDAAVAIATLMCDADGPDGSRSCPEVLRQSTFGNHHGLECVEIELREVITTEEPRSFKTRTRGPIYAVRLPHPSLQFILFFEFEPDYKPGTSDTHVLQEIVNSVEGKTESRQVK